LEIDKIEKAIQTEARVASIDAPITEDDGTTMADMMSSSSEYASDRQVDYESMCSDLMQVLCSVLNERERKIVLQSFGIGCQERGLDDIGSEMGLTRERVRQIRERSLEKIRKNKKSRLLLRHIG
jgi:RNA polymerase primary sigma factor